MDQDNLDRLREIAEERYPHLWGFESAVKLSDGRPDMHDIEN